MYTMYTCTCTYLFESVISGLDEGLSSTGAVPTEFSFPPICLSASVSSASPTCSRWSSLTPATSPAATAVSDTDWGFSSSFRSWIWGDKFVTFHSTSGMVYCWYTCLILATCTPCICMHMHELVLVNPKYDCANRRNMCVYMYTCISHEARERERKLHIHVHMCVDIMWHTHSNIILLWYLNVQCTHTTCTYLFGLGLKSTQQLTHAGLLFLLLWIQPTRQEE